VPGKEVLLRNAPLSHLRNGSWNLKFSDVRGFVEVRIALRISLAWLMTMQGDVRIVVLTSHVSRTRCRAFLVDCSTTLWTLRVMCLSRLRSRRSQARQRASQLPNCGGYVFEIQRRDRPSCMLLSFHDRLFVNHSIRSLHRWRRRSYAHRLVLLWWRMNR